MGLSKASYVIQYAPTSFSACVTVLARLKRFRWTDRITFNHLKILISEENKTGSNLKRTSKASRWRFE